VQRAETILVMHNGQLREMGTHQQLLAERGLYWKLYQLQYKDQEVLANHHGAQSSLAGDPASGQLPIVREQGIGIAD
jgi:ATP-binding cassette subfamily B protein